MRIGAKLWLPIGQLILALCLLGIAGRQTPTTMQDSSPFVPTATRISEAINAPAAILAAFCVDAFGRITGTYQVFAGEVVFLLGVPLLWSLVANEFGTRTSSRFRIASIGFFLLALAIIMGLFGMAEWRQRDFILAIGTFTWSIAVIGFCGLCGVRFGNSTTPRHKCRRI